MLAQDHPAWQLIVVDDGSDTPLDDVQTRFQDRRITFLRLPSNQGQAAARNTALSMAQGELITFLDADNYWDSRFLSVMAAALKPTVNAIWRIAANTSEMKSAGRLPCAWVITIPL